MTDDSTRDQAAVRSWLVHALARAQGTAAADIDPSAPFHDHGITSSEAISICGELEEWLGRPLPPTLLYDHPTIDALAETLCALPERAAGGLATPEPGEVRPAVGVVGMACRFPGGADTPEEFWANLLAGHDASTDVPADRWDATAHYDPDPTASLRAYTTRGAFTSDVAGFDAALFRIPPAEALRMDPQHRMLVEVSWAALEDAGIGPDRLAGSNTGVFVGLMGSQEYARLQTDREPATCLDDPYFGYGSAPSVAAGRLSYLLDLRGPSMCVDTACSSALLAVHLAMQSLHRGECDLAIAAGVSALVHPAAVLQACRAHMLAPDGRCKTFDASADGFLLGEGCGVVVLERVADAHRHGRQVYALLSGSAVNQDGRTNGMTAPNRAAQVRVLTDAVAAAGARADQVGYVEAHGSGTRLGDAVEMSALQEVFGVDRDPRRPLVVGAVKTNVGHLLGAAGIAGLIKAVFAVRSGQIPANLHLHQPSPAIDWQRCPVLLPTTTVQWPAGDGPRVAGVSSFGWSGTNVHVVVEQATPAMPRARQDAAAWSLLPLSARTPTALADLAHRLADRLAEDGVEVAIGDVAHTLQTGRAELDHRVGLVCRDVPDAVAALRAVRPGETRAARVCPRTLFLFPGAGEQYPGMGRELYVAEPEFAAAVDECARLALPVLGRDLREIVHSGGSARGLAELLGRGEAGHAAGQVDSTELAHCAVFTVDYALARLWRGWGVRPDALFGYSLGEYAAACVAGVFSLPDALRVVAERARLIAAGPRGGMLAVALPADEVEPLLPTGLAVAAVNGPAMTVVAGPVEAVAELARGLTEHGVAHQRINANHALHTRELAPVRDAVAELVGQVERAAPEIPFVSCRTGTWITPEQACDPGYWADQMCQPVRCAQGLGELVGPGGGLAVELGPGQTLSALANQVVGADLLAIPTLLPPLADGVSEHEYALRALGRYWAAGGRVAWPTRPGRTVRLPTYPFEHQRFWPDSAPTDQQPGTGERPELARWCHVPVWKQSHVPLWTNQVEAGRWLAFVDQDGPVNAVLDQLAAAGERIVLVRSGPVFQREGDSAFVIDPCSAADYRRLWDDLAEAGPLPTRVLHAWSVAGRKLLDHGMASLMFTAAALGPAAREHPITLFVLTAGLHNVLGDEPVDPWQATAFGVAGTVDHEFPGLRCRAVDLPGTRTGAEWPAAVVRGVVAELRADAADPHVAYRNGQRWVRCWEPVPLGPVERDRVWRDRGVYLITGGFGELGLTLARDLARRSRARLVLLGRTALPPRAEWDGVDTAEVARRVQAVRELERLGAEVLPVTGDVAEPADVARALALARQRFGAVHGVVHAAGVPGGGLIALRTRQDAERVLRPKVLGALALSEALRGAQLDFLVLYSSSVVALGGLGESDYCAANTFLDFLAHDLRGRGLPVTSVDWGPWQRDAWTASQRDALGAAWPRLRELRQRYGIGDADGVELLTRVLAANLAQVLVLPADPASAAARWRALSTELTAAGEGGAQRSYPRPVLRTPYAPPRTRLERLVAETWRRHLGLDRVGVHDQFFELGGTSLVGMTIAARLDRELGGRLSAADLFAAPTPAALATLIAQRTGAAEPSGPRGTRGADRRRLAATGVARRDRRAKGDAR